MSPPVVTVEQGIAVKSCVAYNFRNTYAVLLVCPSTLSRTSATAPLRRSLTMATKKPPVDPPDTDSYGEESSYGTHSEAIGHNSAESSESFDANSEEIEYVERPLAPEPKVHPVQVTVIKDGNGSRFLANLLINLQKVDASAKILPQPEASSQFAPLQRTKDIPNDKSARTFVSAYIADIRVTPQGDMKGKVWIQSQAKFPNIKKNTKFSEWLNGSTESPTSPRIELKLSVLTGGTRIFATGIFLNIVTRFDLVQNFQDQIWNALATTVDDSGPIPEFQIEIFHAHGKTGRTRLYRMVTSSAEYADVLNIKMMKIMPSPSADIIYIKYKVWDLLPNSKKTAYYDMQKSFADNHGALILRGIRNPQAMVGKLNATGTESTDNGKSMTVYSWLTVLKAADKFTLFPKVLPCENGEIELWHHTSHAQEARAWATTALAEIARLAKIECVTDSQRANDLFNNPDKVQKCINRMKHEISLPQARTAFLNYLPPVRSGDATQARQGQRHRKPRAGPPKLVFDLDAVTEAKKSTTNATPVTAWTIRHDKGKYPHSAAVTKPSNATTDQAMSEEEIAKCESTKAIAMADMLTKKYPSQGNTAHQGRYETIADKYGNLVPVVALKGNWVVLTEKTLIASRKNATPRNFGIASVGTKKAGRTTIKAVETSDRNDKPAAKKRWGDEDSSEDEWAKAQNESFQWMDITVDTAEFDAYVEAEEKEKENQEMSGRKRQSTDTKQDDTSSDVVMDEATMVHRAELAHQDDEEATANRGVSFAATAAKRLFTTEIAGSQTGTQASINVPESLQAHNDIRKLTVLQSGRPSAKPAVLFNAEPPGRKVGPQQLRRSQEEHARHTDRSEWQTVAERHSKGRQKTQAQEEQRRPMARVDQSTNFEATTLQNVERSEELKRIAERNSALEKQNAELVAMMADNQRMLQDLSITNAALTAAMAALTSTHQPAAQADETKANIDEPVSLHVDELQMHTPVNQRKSKKSSLEELAVRTPPKPPEGTPRRRKKKKVSESPALNPNTSNRFSPLQNATSDDEDSDSPATQNESISLAPVEIMGKLVAQDDLQQATATTTPTIQQIMPGSGSNGVGKPE